MKPLPEKTLAKIFSGTLTQEQIQERVRFFGSKGHDVRPVTIEAAYLWGDGKWSVVAGRGLNTDLPDGYDELYACVYRTGEIRFMECPPDRSGAIP